MSSPKTRDRRALATRLAAYTGSLAALATGAVAEAAPVRFGYSGAEFTAFDGSIGIDIDQNGTVDFTIAHAVGSAQSTTSTYSFRRGTARVTVAAAGSNGWKPRNNGGEPDDVGHGAFVGYSGFVGGTAGGGSAGPLAFLTASRTIYSGGEASYSYQRGGGDWFNAAQGVDGYLGVRFARGAETLFGWARLRVEGTAEASIDDLLPPTSPVLRVTLLETGYESTFPGDVNGVGVRSQTGAGELQLVQGAVPEPSSLAFLALGAVGVTAMRKHATRRADAATD